jgi:Ni/Co efflux regulator RcnB
MKRLFICAVALGLFAAVPAMSAPKGDHHDNKSNAGATGATFHGASGAAHLNTSGGAFTGGTHTGTGGASSHTVLSGHSFSGGAFTGGTHTGTGGASSHTALSHTFSTGAMTGGTHTGTGGASSHTALSHSFSTGAVTGGNTMGRNTSITSLRLNVQASHHFHNGNYNAPQGYQYRHWGYGDRLPRGYYARNYWITDFLTFGLFAPPDGLVWVRVGDDALLIDEYTGEVIQVDYGVFY